MKAFRSRITHRAAGVFAVALLTGLAASPSRAQRGPLEDLARFPRTTLTIHAGGAAQRFSVWIADTDARKEQGLMFVRDLPGDQGMLFTHCCGGIWMKNTYIELDILFIGADGHIIKIAQRAHPFDETTISPGGIADEVVELKGGEAERRHLQVGDLVEWKPPS
jgi:uncharacterized protein